MATNKGMRPDFKKHKAVYNGRMYEQSTTDWARMFDIHIGQVEQGLRDYYSMQAYIDECHAKRQTKAEALHAFAFRGRPA